MTPVRWPFMCGTTVSQSAARRPRRAARARRSTRWRTTRAMARKTPPSIAWSRWKPTGRKPRPTTSSHLDLKLSYKGIGPQMAPNGVAWYALPHVEGYSSPTCLICPYLYLFLISNLSGTTGLEATIMRIAISGLIAPWAAFRTPPNIYKDLRKHLRST